MSDPSIAPIVGNAYAFQNVAELLDEVKRLRAKEKSTEEALAALATNAVAELRELKKVVENETWEYRPMQRAVLAGIQLSINELSGNKRPR